MICKKDFYYNLPENLIAQSPIDKRDNSRLLVYIASKINGGGVAHCYFYDIINYLNAGDTLVLNTTRVIPARLYGRFDDKKIEIFLHKKLSLNSYEVLVKPGRRAEINNKIIINDKLYLIIKDITESGERIVEFFCEGILEEQLERAGTVPLPPYIKENLDDGERYQTVYGKEKGSCAAPTAGLHFTDELLKKISENGVNIARLLLHVGLGTFRPVKDDDIEKHKMHSEYFELDAQNAELINKTRKSGGRVIAVGTTSTRVLESIADENGFVKAQKGNTDIFIYPPYKFKAIDGLITNFHLPESTLIMLVSAFIGREKTLELYNTAIEKEYRFFSFGDCMLLLP